MDFGVWIAIAIACASGVLAMMLQIKGWPEHHAWLIPVLWSGCALSILFAILRKRSARVPPGSNEAVEQKSTRQETHGPYSPAITAMDSSTVNVHLPAPTQPARSRDPTHGREPTEAAKAGARNTPILVDYGVGSSSDIVVLSGQSESLRGRRINAYYYAIGNGQMEVLRIARNVRATLRYEHAEDQFVVSSSVWFELNDNILTIVRESVDLGPGDVGRFLFAVRENADNAPCFAVKLGMDGRLVPAQSLRFGRWNVTGDVSMDFGDPLPVAAAFRIDMSGNLVGA